MKFELKNLIGPAVTVGGVSTGLVTANVLKNVLFVPGEGKEKPLIPDNVGTNLAGMALGFAGAAFIKNNFAQIACASIAAFFGLRSINKGTESLQGLGEAEDGGTGESFKSKIAKGLKFMIPNLGEVESDNNNVIDNDLQKIIARANRAQIPASSGPAIQDGNINLVGISQKSNPFANNIVLV